MEQLTSNPIKCWFNLIRKGNLSSRLPLLLYLQAQYPQSRIAVIWDGASDHRSNERSSSLYQITKCLLHINYRQ